MPWSGSEGTLGIVTSTTVRLVRLPEEVRTILVGFETTDQAGAATSAIISAGIVPAAIEMMDALAIEAAEAAVHCNYPEGAGAVLVIELDGASVEVEQEYADVERLCTENGAFEQRLATDPVERALIWKGRKSAFAAVGRISPDYIVQDGVIPRTALPEVLKAIADLSTSSGVRVANVFHAGDGNLHPLVLFDDAVEGAGDAAEKVSGAILDLCISHGGSITGEHGVGMDKAKYMPRMYTDEDLDTMQMVRCAFDPHNISNPGKVFPTPAAVRGGARTSQGRPPVAGSRPRGGVLMTSTTIDGTAREAVASACADVQDAQPADHVDGVRPALVARPADTDQVAEVLRAAASHGLTVVPRGRGTKMSWGTPPSSADVLLDVSALDQVLDHAAGDLIVATQAGARLADLQQVVAQGGQRLALDETVPGASIGGTLATNASGPRRVAVGTARDLLIGVTVVRADGVVAKAGGRVVKNVAGYDLGKLVIGSAGTLAVVTEAVFRLHPVPAAHRWVGVPAPTRPRPSGSSSPCARAGRSRCRRGRLVPRRPRVGARAPRGSRRGRRGTCRHRARPARRDLDGSSEAPGRRCDVPLGRHGHRRPALRPRSS